MVHHGCKSTLFRWVTPADKSKVAALAAASAGKDVPQVYQLATAGLSKTDQKIVQRRVKEAIFKTSVLSGVPRALQALLPLFETLEDDEIDHAGPR